MAPTTNDPLFLNHMESPLIPFREVPRLPWMRRREGKLLNQSTLWRWRQKGIKHPVTGERVKLRALRVGGICCTTQTWLLEFWETLSSNQPLPHVVSRSRVRLREMEAAERELSSRGM